jgi:PAS domain S-box-containing protein
MRRREGWRAGWKSYVLAVLVTAVAVALRWLIDPWVGELLAFGTLYAAAATSVWLGGYRPALFAAPLGYFACDYLFIAPRGEIGTLNVATLVALPTYLVTCSIIISFGEVMRRAQAQAKKQRELLRITLASIGDGVITTDTQGRVAFLNAVAQSLTGWTQEEAAGRPLGEVFRIRAEGSRAALEDPAAQALRQGSVVELANHAVLIAKDGKERPVDDSAAPIRDDHGRIAGCVLVFRDVSERRRAEAELRRSERELSDFFENANVGLHWVGPDGSILRVNQTELDLLGYAREEYIGHHISEFHADGDVIEDILGRLAEGKTLQEWPARLRGKDGSVKHVRISSNVLWVDGAFIHTRCFTRDVTEQKRAEALLLESEALFRTLGEAVPDFLWMTDAQGRPIYENPAWRQYVGMTHEELLERGWEAFHHPEDRPLLRKLLAQARAGGEALQFEVRARRHDGEYRWFAGRSVPLKDDAGRVIKWVGTMTDIHDLKHAEEALLSADRRKDEFLATLAHELRNPLAPIRNSLEILKRAEGDPGSTQEARRTMERQLSHMERLIDDLLDISRITRNRLELRMQTVELASVVHHALEACRPLAEAFGHEVAVSLPPDPIYLNGDPVRLAQVFGNLLSNSCKYTDPGGRIWLSAAREGSEVVVSVKDDGIGIPPDMLPHVFEMFTQVDRTLERSRGGLGIGLTLVKELVERHDGSVEPSSAGPGQGSEFVVRLPILLERPEAGIPPPPPSRPPALSLRILVVDDNQDSAESLALLLRLTGHETELAYDGLAAVEAAERFQPDVVLLDIGLPKLNGFDACRRIREQPWGKRMVVVALTGWGQDEDRRKSKDAGFDSHLVKPVDHAALIELLAALAGGGD